MFHSGQLNKRINRLYERAFRLIYDDYNETFDKFLEPDIICTIHENNIQQAIEIIKVKHGVALEVFEYMFVMRNPHNQAQNLFSVYQKSIQNILEKTQQDT